MISRKSKKNGEKKVRILHEQPLGAIHSLARVKTITEVSNLLFEELDLLMARQSDLNSGDKEELHLYNHKVLYHK